MGRFCGDRMGRFCGDHVGRFCGDRMGRFCGNRMGRFCGNRMGSVSGDRIGSGDRVGLLICYAESWDTRGNLFILTNKTNTIIAITADSENGQEDARRGELCVERRKRKIHFNTLGESGRVAGGRIETL
jgi:hypothetical protein